MSVLVRNTTSKMLCIKRSFEESITFMGTTVHCGSKPSPASLCQLGLCIKTFITYYHTNSDDDQQLIKILVIDIVSIKL